MSEYFFVYDYMVLSPFRYPIKRKEKITEKFNLFSLCSQVDLSEGGTQGNCCQQCGLQIEKSLPEYPTFGLLVNSRRCYRVSLSCISKLS